MRPSIFLLLGAALPLLVIGNARSEDLVALSKSSIWQVRYCTATKFDAPTAQARECLERLCRDEMRQIAQHTFSIYSLTFVVLDRELVRTAFSRGDFDLVGVDVKDRKAFETPEFWVNRLENAPDDSSRADAIRRIGLCGTAANFAKLSEFSGSPSPYLLLELSLAFHRLGDTEKYLTTLDTLLALPISRAFYYQTAAIDCLIQTHPDRARQAWKRVHQQFEKNQNLQPAWVYSHILQESRLP